MEHVNNELSLFLKKSLFLLWDRKRQAEIFPELAYFPDACQEPGLDQAKDRS